MPDPDEDEKDHAAARALDSMPPEAPTVVTELPADVRLLARSVLGDNSETPKSGIPVPKKAIPPRPPQAPSSFRPSTPPLAPAPPPPPTSSAVALEREVNAVDDAWGGPEAADSASRLKPETVDVEAPTVAAALDTSSLANIPLPPSLAGAGSVGLVGPAAGAPPPFVAPAAGEHGMGANVPSPLASTHGPQHVGALQPVQFGVRQTARMNPPGPAEAPWANPNAPQWVPPAPRPSLIDQPSGIGWAIGGLVVGAVLLLLVGYLVWFALSRFL